MIYNPYHPGSSYLYQFPVNKKWYSLAKAAQKLKTKILDPYDDWEILII